MLNYTIKAGEDSRKNLPVNNNCALPVRDTQARGCKAELLHKFDRQRGNCRSFKIGENLKHQALKRLPITERKMGL